MGMYKYIRDFKKNNPEKFSELKRERLIKWRREPSTVRIDRPTNLSSARSLGYKPKNGVIVVRQRVLRGGRMRPKITGGRRPKHNRRKKIVHKNYKQIAEEKANRAYVNCEVLNSYKVIEDGKHIWYEVILIDRFNPEVLADPNLKASTKRKGRAYRGLTTAGRKSRGISRKGTGTEKTRPSKSANFRKKTKKD